MKIFVFLNLEVPVWFFFWGERIRFCVGGVFFVCLELLSGCGKLGILMFVV